VIFGIRRVGIAHNGSTNPLETLTRVWNIIKDAVVALGWAKGMFTLFFWVAHYALFKAYKGRLKDRQDEIDRLAKDNHEYRDRFLAVLDRYFDLPSKGSSKNKSVKKQKG